jgi:hypothetical protein
VTGREDIVRQDAEALLEVRRDLGPSYDAALVDSFAERIEKAVAERVDAQVAEHRQARRDEGSSDSRQLALSIVSLGTGIPITAISASLADGLPGVLVAWAGIVGVNVAYALRGRRRSR